MLSKKSRLPRLLFSVAKKNARRFTGAYVSLSMTPAPDARFAVVIGKKVATSAALRNTIRRRMYATFRECAGEASPRGHYIATMLPSSRNASYKALKEDVRALLARRFPGHSR